MLNDKQRNISMQLTWPSQYRGGTSTHLDSVLYINGVRVIIYPSGALDILTVEDSESAREAEAVIRERAGDKILGHVRTYRR